MSLQHQEQTYTHTHTHPQSNTAKCQKSWNRELKKCVYHKGSRGWLDKQQEKWNKESNIKWPKSNLTNNSIKYKWNKFFKQKAKSQTVLKSNTYVFSTWDSFEIQSDKLIKKGWKRRCHANNNHSLAGVAILLLDKRGFKISETLRNSTRNKEGHFIHTCRHTHSWKI